MGIGTILVSPGGYVCELLYVKSLEWYLENTKPCVFADSVSQDFVAHPAMSPSLPI